MYDYTSKTKLSSHYIFIFIFIIFIVFPTHVQIYIMKGCDLHLSKNIVIHIDNELCTIFAELLCPPNK